MIKNDLDVEYSTKAARVTAARHAKQQQRINEETRDYAMYLDNELVGFARTYHEAKATLDQLVFELMSGQYFREAGV